MSEILKASQSEVIAFILKEYRESIRLQETHIADYTGLALEDITAVEEMKAVKDLDKLTTVLNFYGFSIGQYFQVVDTFIYTLVQLGVEVTPEALGDLIEKAFQAGIDNEAYMEEVRLNGYRPFLRNPGEESTVIVMIKDYVAGVNAG